MNPLIGRTITRVMITSDKKALRFHVDGAEPVVVKVDGDCCSDTWIESLDAPENLFGTVLSIKDIEMPDLGTPEEYECIAYYGCRIVTDKGVCVIDYRNSSNGYYGGNLYWPDDGYYYGGVYGQNEHNND